MRAFWLELKSVCKNFKFLAIIFLLLAYQVMLFSQFQGESKISESRETWRNYLYASENNGLVNYWGRRLNHFQQHGEPLFRSPHSLQRVESDLAWYQYEKTLADNITISFESKDWATYNRNMAQKNLLEWNMHGMIRAMNQRYRTLADILTPEEYFGESWDYYSTLVDDPEFDTLIYFWPERMTQSPEQAMMWSAYYLHLLKEDLPPAGPHDTRPWGFTFNFLRRGLPNILGAIVLLMTVNLLHRDKKFGAIKSALQLPRGRTYYLIRKVSLGFLSSLFVVIIPQFLMFLVFGIKQGFWGFNFPVLIHNSVTNWSVLPNHMMYTLQHNTRFFEFGLSRYQLSWFPDYSAIEQLSIIPLWQFLSLAFVHMALFILFCSVLGILISILIKNEILAQVIAIGTFALGTAFGSIFPQLKTTSWDIFSKANTIPLLEGSHLVTYLNSLAVITIAITLLFIVSTIIFRKQDIVSN